MLIRRYFQDDLKTAAYTNASSRIVAVTLLITAVHQVWPSAWSVEQELATAFLIGVFPQVGLKALQNLIALPLRPLIPSLERPYPLSDLDGLNIWYEARLLEEGVEDMQNLATANLVDVMLRTRVPVERLIDWVDQAHLYLRVGKERSKDAEGREQPSDRDMLRRLGIRTATDLEDAFRPSLRPGADGRMEPDPIEESPEFLERLRGALDRPGETLPSATRSILKTFAREPNLYHVRQWKSFSWGLDRAQSREDHRDAAGQREAGSVVPGEPIEDPPVVMPAEVSR
jgi:hypothetical protein